MPYLQIIHLFSTAKLWVFLSYDKLWKRTFLFFSLAIFRQPTVWSMLGLAQGVGCRLRGTGLLCIIMTSEEKQQKIQLKKEVAV